MRSKNEQTLSAILTLINDCYFQEGTYPSLQQIANAVGLSTTQTYRYVDELIKRGEIDKRANSVICKQKKLRILYAITIVYLSLARLLVADRYLPKKI